MRHRPRYLKHQAAFFPKPVTQPACRTEREGRVRGPKVGEANLRGPKEARNPTLRAGHRVRNGCELIGSRRASTCDRASKSGTRSNNLTSRSGLVPKAEKSNLSLYPEM